MADSNDLDLDLETQDNKGSLPEQRIKELSNKVKLTSKERDELAESNKQATARAESATKEVEFYKGFSTLAGTYPNASEHTDEIKAKVLAGYTVEDATVSVLAKQGKLTSTPQERQSAAGGSATNPPGKSGPKELKDMSRDEKRQALMDAEARGDIGVE